MFKVKTKKTIQPNLLDEMIKACLISNEITHLYKIHEKYQISMKSYCHLIEGNDTPEKHLTEIF